MFYVANFGLGFGINRTFLRINLYYSDIMTQIDILEIDTFRNGSLKNGFYVNRLSSHLRQSHHRINRPHKHDFYAVILFTSGCGTHEIDFASFQVKPGAIFFLSPGQTHNWQLSADAEGFVLFHTQEFFNGQYAKLGTENFVFYSGLSNISPIVLSDADLKDAATGFGKILMENAVSASKGNYMILSLLTGIYILCERLAVTRDVEMSGRGSYSATLSRFRELLEKHYPNEKLPQWYAGRLSISQRHLNRIVKTLLGRSPSDLIAERIILEAKRMLLHTSLNFSEIAAELGYPDYAYFSRLFRKRVGSSPSQFVSQYSGFPPM